MKKNNMKWAVKTLILSISLSIVFSFLSQSLFPKLSIFLSIFIIIFFIIVSVIFDMIGIAVASVSLDKLEMFKNEKGFKTACKLCENTEKVSSFCGDVVGDICGILSGAGGVSLVLSMNIHESNVYFVVTCLISSLIAGLTIFGKAVMKGYAVERCDRVVMLTGQFMESSPLFSFKALKRKNNSKEIDKNKKEIKNKKILKK